jgi:tRNA(Ile)-lysidine synthase
MNQMTSLPERLTELFLKNCHFKTDSPLPLLIGISGGPDSVTLLHWIHTQQAIPVQPILAHVNYHMRGADSDADESFVRELADTYQVPLEITHPDFSHTTNFQAVARTHRLRFFQRLYNKHDVQALLLGHHLDDQVETVLHHLFIGAGLKGLAGIPYFTELYGMTIIRPLLQEPKSELVEWLDQEGIVYRTDQSNMQSKYTRNQIRNEIIPLVKQYFPAYRSSIQKASHVLHETYLHFEYTSEQLFYSHIRWFRPYCYIFDCKTVKQWSYIQFTEWIRFCWGKLTRQRDRISFVEINTCYDQLHQTSLRGCQVLLDHPPFYIVREYGTLVFYRDIPAEDYTQKPPQTIDFTTLKQERNDIVQCEIGFGKWTIRFSKTLATNIPNSPKAWRIFHRNGNCLLPLSALSSLCITGIHEGDRFEYAFGKHKKLSDYFIDQKIPIRLRNQSLVLRSQDNVVLLIVPPPVKHLRVAASMYVDAQKDTLVLVEVRRTHLKEKEKQHG